MYNFFLQTIAFVSLGAIIYLFARAIPRVNDSGEENIGKPSGLRSYFDRLGSRLPLSKIDAILNSFFEKFLRKSKVIVMKVDNLLNMYINKVRKVNGNGKGSNGSKNGTNFAASDSQNSGEPKNLQ